MGNKSKLIQLTFHNVNDLITARRLLQPQVEKNKLEREVRDDFDDTVRLTDPELLIYDIREYDVPYHVRVAIDEDIRVGKWYTVEAKENKILLTEMPERIARADPVVLAFDIETTKLPLKFPDAAFDKVMMISYMIDGQGYLITNREIVSQDIEDFEYTPKPEYPGHFIIFNEADEKALLLRFFEHIQEEKPTVIATFNGDFFDWPFVEARASYHGIDMYEEIGFQKDSEDEYKSTYCCHMDCFRWVKRDSYLPQGSQGLKAVTKAKLGYNPIEIDPELMTPYAMEKPQTMAEYSVSDAVATYYLYMKYVHPFIFSLCNIIPLNPDEVLRKGTGTLCEMLLMVQAYKGNIVLPNKHTDPLQRFYKGHLVETETYVGGHVESLEAGVFRNDIEYDFKVDPTAIDELISDLDNALKFTVEVESKKKLEEVENYDEIKEAIKNELLVLKNDPVRQERPSIYHVDVASMYPNIMTTNRLQPDSMITEADCAACDFNRPDKNCDRRLPWSWRGEYFPAKLDEYHMLKRALENEKFPGRTKKAPMRLFDDLSPSEQAAQIKKRLGEYSKKVYSRLHLTETIEREAVICQRENPFYVNTVRDFRDRRYDFKNLQKVWKKKVNEVPSSEKEDAKKMVVLYDSLQLAHKVILNSFYGYVMRKGSRWYSMEMAGVTCLTGATIIQMARSMVERLGRPLELDTDGIWCILPKSFPEDFTLNLKGGKKIFISYPCVMLNHLVHAKFTNHQYQNLIDPIQHKYETISDNSIFFEVDGPYKAMMLPTSKEEDKNLKKRYAVFNEDGTLAELKGFELKRRGELKLIKAFQGQIFKEFLQGTTLEECYGSVAKVADNWLDILESKGSTMDMEELLELISENRSMSRSLEEYGNQKSTSITTARRLAEFLGAAMVKDKGLACKYIIADRPRNSPVTERAIPVAIFSAQREVKATYLRKWLKDNSLEEFDPRSIIDWGYYWERLGSNIQKIITIPAALQGVTNPVPRIQHPDWLANRIRIKNDKSKQQSINSFFKSSASVKSTKKTDKVIDIEDMGKNETKKSVLPLVPKMAKVTKRKKTAIEVVDEDEITLPARAPSIDGDYKEYLKYHKLKWKLQKQARDRRKQLFGNVKNTSGLSGMLMNSVEKTYSSSWHLVQVANTERAGVVRATVCVNNKLQNIKVKIPRQIFVNFKPGFKLPDLEISGAIVHSANNYTLPNGVVSPTLFKYEMPEEVYQAELRKPDGLFNNELVDGIYEGDINSVDNAVLHLGLCCDVSNKQTGLLGQGLAQGFDLDWLVPNTEVSYLSNSAFSYIYCLHVVSSDYQVFSIISTKENKAYALILRPSRNSQKLPNLDKVYEKLYSEKKLKLKKTNKIFEYQDQLDFEDIYFDDIGKLYKQMNRILEGLQSTQAILCLQSPHPHRLSKLVRALNEFPIVKLKANNLQVPAIGWQQAVSKKLVTQYFGLAKWVGYLLDLSRYGRVPLCNLKCDDAKYLIDINYSRRLRQANIVLWWSESPLPNEGGVEKDDILKEFDSLDLSAVNNPGMYSNVCVDLTISNLSINTILTASLMDTETEVMIENENNEMVPFVENSFSAPALSVLSSMVNEWWNQALESNSQADLMVHSLVPWIMCRSSMMFNRTLYFHVQTLTKKAFVQLIKEFRRSGSKVVYADQNRILLLTSKSNFESAFAYSEYIVKMVRNKPLFHFLDISISRFWNTLLWMDDINYGGMCLQDSENSEIGMDMLWQVRQYLPPILAEELDKYVAQFIEAVHNRWIQPNESNESRLTQLPKFTANELTEFQDDALFKGVVKNMEPAILKRVKLLIRRYIDISNNVNGLPEDDPRLHEFDIPSHPTPGSSKAPLNPVLEMVKTLCAILSLSKQLHLEVRLFRRHLLNLFEIREFSSEGNFVSPCVAGLKIPRVLCASCGHTRDLDFNVAPTWSCPDCGAEYNRMQIEELIITAIMKWVAAYQVQDLRCAKCRKERVSEMEVHCSCSGEWVLANNISNTIKPEMYFDSWKNVARLNDMRLVLDCVDSFQ